MPKRKRDDDDEVVDAKSQRVQSKLKLAIVKVGHAFKVSKGFERQKLGRRRRTAEEKSDDKDVQRIDSEIAALKALDTASSAKHHVHKSLLRVKAVAEHPRLPSGVKEATKLAEDAATLNVHARLCKANPVQEAMSVALTSIQQALGLDVEKPKQGKGRRLRAKDYATMEGLSKSDPVSKARSSNAPDVKTKTAPHGEANDHESGSESGHAVALPDRDPSPRGSIEGSPHPSVDPGHPLKSRRDGYNLESDLSLSDPEPELDSISPEPQKTTLSQRSRRQAVPSISASPEPQKTPTATKASSFLPSLSMAGYISGSDSDIAEDIEVAPRKNRRGQRARQQIWEQKYGSGAKHLQNQGNGVRWDPKRGAVDGDARNRNGNHARARRNSPDYTVGGDGRNAQSRGARNSLHDKKRQGQGEKIHPSWEAAKKAKEKRDAPVAFQGKKITFD